MAKPSKNPSELTRWRMNQGYQTKDLMEESKLSEATIWRIERGTPVSRALISRYLKIWGVDLNVPATLATLPANFHIIDEGWNMRLKISGGIIDTEGRGCLSF